MYMYTHLVHVHEHSFKILCGEIKQVGGGGHSHTHEREHVHVALLCLQLSNHEQIVKMPD